MPDKPQGNQHTGSGTRAKGSSVAQDVGAPSQFAQELAKIPRFFEANKLAYQNIREQNKQDTTDLRIISNFGYQEVRRQEKVSGSEFLFKWLPPRANITITPFTEGIKFITMHSFGSNYDKSRMRGKAVNFVPGSDVSLSSLTDEEIKAGKYRRVSGTGYNPSRFAAGVRELTSPEVTADKSVHHLVSLRGDIVNSVSWDNRCIHSSDNASIGIEHEEFYVNNKADGKGPLYIIDHAPYSLETFVADAFIIKKLQFYTQQTFTRYLGSGSELRNNLLSSTTGCFNHHAIRTEHNDPSAQYYFPPDYQLRKTPLSSINILRPEDHSLWNRWLNRWFPPDTHPDGTRISAYAKIFEIVGRMRAFSLDQIFDSTLRNTAIAIAIPRVTATHHISPLARAALDRAEGFNRADQMQNISRPAHFENAANSSQDSADIWAAQLVTMAQINEAIASAPVIENALRLDSNTGVWFRTTTRNL